MENQKQKLKQAVEGALGKGLDSLLPTSWERVYESAGQHYLALAAGRAHSGLYVDAEEAWHDVVKQARSEYEHQQNLIRDITRPEPRPAEPKPEEEESEIPTRELLSERTKARARALSEFYAFRTGDDTPTRPMRVRVRAGGPLVSRDLEDPNSDVDYRQVVTLEVQAWVSREEVARVYGAVRDNLLEEEGHIKKKPSTLEIAAFAWREWRYAREEGRDLPTWPELRQLWLKYHPGDKRIEGHGDFQKYFNRAKEAVFPKYRDVLFPGTPDEQAEAEARKTRLIQALEGYREKHGPAPLSKPRPRRE